MYLLIHDRSEDFYCSLGLSEEWDVLLARLLDLEEVFMRDMDETERIIFHFNRLGYSIREIADFYGTTFSNIQRTLQRIYEEIDEER